MINRQRPDACHQKPNNLQRLGRNTELRPQHSDLEANEAAQDDRSEDHTEDLHRTQATEDKVEWFEERSELDGVRDAVLTPTVKTCTGRRRRAQETEQCSEDWKLLKANCDIKKAPARFNKLDFDHT